MCVPILSSCLHPQIPLYRRSLHDGSLPPGHWTFHLVRDVNYGARGNSSLPVLLLEHIWCNHMAVLQWGCRWFSSGICRNFRVRSHFCPDLDNSANDEQCDRIIRHLLPLWHNLAGWRRLVPPVSQGDIKRSYGQRKEVALHPRRHQGPPLEPSLIEQNKLHLKIINPQTNLIIHL